MIVAFIFSLNHDNQAGGIYLCLLCIGENHDAHILFIHAAAQK